MSLGFAQHHQVAIAAQLTLPRGSQLQEFLTTLFPFTQPYPELFDLLAVKFSVRLTMYKKKNAHSYYYLMGESKDWVKAFGDSVALLRSLPALQILAFLRRRLSCLMQAIHYRHLLLQTDPPFGVFWFREGTMWP